LSFAAALSLAAVGFYALSFTPDLTVPEDDFFRRVGAALPAAVIVAGFALAPQLDERKRVWWLALAIGNASYSLYLIHEFLLRAFHIVWGKLALGIVPLWVFIPLGIVISVTAALILYRLFEKPVTRWLNGLGRERGPLRAPSIIPLSTPIMPRAATAPSPIAAEAPVFGKRTTPVRQVRSVDA
jgi:peptidoglycan/LPS O-acetylase OafA/YrhL